MILKISAEDLEISRKYQCMCLKTGGSFRNGCPNYGKKSGCPPRKLFDEDYDMSRDIYLIVSNFDLTEHTQRIRTRHPTWTEKAVYNPRYWQATARKLHEREIEAFTKEHPGYSTERTPEGAGINVDLLCQNHGIELEWPPRKLTRIVSVGGVRRH